MEDKKKQKSPKTIKAIVADLRAKGELDEEKWKDYQKRESDVNRYFLKAYIIPSMLFIWAIFFHCISLKCVFIYIIFLTIVPIGFIRVMQQMSAKGLYFLNYGIPKKAKVIKIKDIKRNNIQKITCQAEDKIYHVEFSKNFIENHDYHVNDKINIVVHPVNKEDAIFVTEQDHKNLYLRKETCTEIS